MTAVAHNVRTIGVARAAPRKRAKKREYLYAKGPVGVLRTLLDRAGSRLAKHATRARAYGLPPGLHIIENVESAVAALNDAVEGLNCVPADWKPLPGSLGFAKAFEVGSRVRVKLEKRGERIELSNPGALLEIVRVAGSKTVCAVLDGADAGTKIVVPRGHLEPVR